MKYKKLAFSAFLFACCSCSVIQKKDDVSKNLFIEAEKAAYFVPIPITKSTSFQSPCLDVKIEEKTFLLKLDLGFQGDMTMTKEAMDSILSKTFVGERSMYGVRGKEYKKKLYQIQKAKIGLMAFSPPILQEENAAFLKDAEFLLDKHDAPLREEQGRLGWELFCNTNLLLDMQNSLIAFCDGLNTLSKEGYEVEEFIKTPLFLDRGLVEFEASTPNGCLRCVLDTGATWNILNTKLESGQSIDTVVWKEENILKYPFFTIGGMNFGPTSFHQIPINLPIQIDAILGMDFFEENIVFLDFSKKIVYFYKPKID